MSEEFHGEIPDQATIDKLRDEVHRSRAREDHFRVLYHAVRKELYALMDFLPRVWREAWVRSRP